MTGEAGRVYTARLPWGGWSGFSYQVTGGAGRVASLVTQCPPATRSLWPLDPPVCGTPLPQELLRSLWGFICWLEWLLDPPVFP